MPVDSTLERIELPEFGLPDVEPAIPAEIYRDRLERLREHARDTGLAVVVVYGDREHFTNLTYLTGYDPRFEEALLVVPTDGRPTLVVGNEGTGYVDVSSIASDLEVELYQSFSLLGQDRDESDSLGEILSSAGVESGTTIGLAGWKHFPEFDEPAHAHEVPAYVVETLREVAGGRSNVRNCNRLFMDSTDGLRTINEVDQLAQFEFASCYTSQAVRNLLFGLEPGMTEYEAVQLMEYTGLPLSCHLMCSAGPRAAMGLPSPSSRVVERGDPFTTAYGAWGALNSRAGFVVEGRNELPDGISDYVDKLVGPYFEAVVAWYETLELGVEGQVLYEAIHSRIGDPFFGVELNPGHLIHLDEWVDSPVYEDSTETMRSGMAVQVDVIPATGTEYFMTNIEDGIALADEDLRGAFADRYPGAWERITARRAFMEDVLGIDLAPEILPLSNIPAYLPPYLLAPDRAMRMER
ncbi:aminopeptidase P family N-terminal domain-containing protein [Halomontanus rarus]|uniref:aminopeptidase P family N-terminal domain-containing protein n=1 Tax=Halomontanus rarus TaxID=3034020 RepID=UPI0023E7EA1A|nr:aminopeptidase P family N-terminal domain-containing protein [Halovivax sp. TS33]